MTMAEVPIGDGVYCAQVVGNKDKENPLHCGTFSAEPGKGTPFDYPCSAIIVITAGEFTVEDTANPGPTTSLKANDIISVDKGSHLKWHSAGGGKAFYIIQLPLEANPTDYTH